MTSTIFIVTGMEPRYTEVSYGEARYTEVRYAEARYDRDELLLAIEV